MDRGEITAKGLTPRERAEKILSWETIYGLDREDTAKQRAGLIRCRIVDAIEASLRDAMRRRLHEADMGSGAEKP